MTQEWHTIPAYTLMALYMAAAKGSSSQRDDQKIWRLSPPKPRKVQPRHLRAQFAPCNSLTLVFFLHRRKVSLRAVSTSFCISWGTFAARYPSSSLPNQSQHDLFMLAVYGYVLRRTLVTGARWKARDSSAPLPCTRAMSFKTTAPGPVESMDLAELRSELLYVQILTTSESRGTSSPVGFELATESFSSPLQWNLHRSKHKALT